MTLWMVTPVRGGRVAIRIRNLDDRPRRIDRREADSEQVSEQWRCSRCFGWFPSEIIELVESGRTVAGAPEIAAHCGPCASGPSRSSCGP
jgi:hypothetical protein